MSSSGLRYWKHHTCNHTTSSGSFMASNHLRMRYCVTFPHLNLEMFLQVSYIFGNIIMCKSIDVVASLLLGIHLYMIPQVAPPTAISLISSKQCKKVISQTRNFILFMIHSHSEWMVAATFMASAQGLYSYKTNWTQSLNNTKTYSPHLSGFLCTFWTSNQLI